MHRTSSVVHSYPFRHKYAPGLDKFWVVTPITNPVRYKSRYALYDRFRLGVERAGANLMTVEIALGDRPFEVTGTRGKTSHVHDLNPDVLKGQTLETQLRTWDELWHKENQVNLGVSRLPADAEYVAWVDGDIEFLRADWAEETVHLLQRYQVIQMFQNALDLGPTGEVVQVHNGAVWSWLNNIPAGTSTMGYYPTDFKGSYYHPGFAWAARREAFDHLGGLLDTAVLGAADHHMFWGLVGQADKSLPGFISSGYERHVMQWQDRANRHIRQDIGFMNGTVQHFHHGPKKARRYLERWDIVKKWNFDPDLHLKKDWQGLYQLSDQGADMRNDLRAYFDGRNEDDLRVE